MGQISLSLPVVGQPDSTEEPKIPTALTTIQTLVNGNLDSTNLVAALAQSATVNQASQIVKGATNISASESRTNTAYGTLTTPDQVTGLVLPTNGLIAIWYHATWQESVGGAARAAIFIGANQLQIAQAASPQTQAAATNNAGVSNRPVPLWTCSQGIVSAQAGVSYTGDVTTGQVVGSAYVPTSEVAGGVGIVGANAANSDAINGPCYVFAAAGTYTVSVQFKASSGSVTASNRHLWVQAISFA